MEEGGRSRRKAFVFVFVRERNDAKRREKGRGAERVYAIEVDRARARKRESERKCVRVRAWKKVYACTGREERDVERDRTNAYACARLQLYHMNDLVPHEGVMSYMDESCPT